MNDAPWTRDQRAVVVACFLGWMLDAFDFFLLVFVLTRVAQDLHTTLKTLTWAITVTLMMRPIGALLFGRLADRYGRRPLLMASVLLYSIMECACAFAPSLGVFLVLRALYGVAMGGEWGVGASLAFETIPVRSRGLVSGLLQTGYPTGYLLAAVAFGVLFPLIGWRGMFLVGALPAVLVFYINSRVPESPTWQRQQAERRHDAGPSTGLWAGLKGHWGLAVYAVLLMTAFNFFSHGTQDLYPTFMRVQRGLSTHAISIIAVIYNIGAICGGLSFGRLSSRIGRRYAMAVAAVLALPVLPWWAFSHSAVAIAIAAFVMQFMVQGAWGVVPVHLNELSPAGIRATFPGVVYQFGNLIASSNATLQATLAERLGGVAHPDYASALTLFCGVTAVVLLTLALVGPERRDARLD
jgi:SHS family lactate transporter-like MFS transporter